MTSTRPFLGKRARAGSLFVFLAMVSIASAQTRTWTTTAPAGDTGNWSDTTKWSGGDVPDTSGEVATFGAYANNRTITLDGNYTIGGLNIFPRTTGFSGMTFSLTGANTLTIGSGGFTIGGGTSISISSNIALGADQTWTSGGGSDNTPASLTVSGIISGDYKLTRTTFSSAGSNTVTFTGANTFTGGFVNATANPAAVSSTRIGSSSVVTGGLIESGPLGTGTVTLNSGTLSGNNTTARTLHNNVVIGGNMILGNSSNNGGLTFSDAGLTTATTFTLGSANNGNVTVLRTPNTALTIDQVIAETGGTGQSVNFATTTGTPTVTINKTKTATGSILVGGVNLVLANGAANSGALVGVNGSITATGANKFSSGALISDNTSLIATDATNYSAVAGGKATVYNNGRVSFVTDQTQAVVAGLFSEDSQVRLGLGSGSASATVTENYDQSAIGNGKAGLVSASTGTITYNGTLTAGSDATYRVGGGLGTLALGTALAGANNLTVEGGGTITTGVDNTYIGATTVNSSVTVTGASGALSGTSGVTVNNGATLTLTNNTGAVNANRVADTAGITLNNGLIALTGSSTTAASETLGDLTINSGGRNFITIAQTPAAATVKTLQFGNLTRNAGTVAVFRGDTLGTTATARNEIKFSSAPALVGGGGAAGTTNISVLPWARGGTGSGNQATGLVTYEANGIRQLNSATEYVQANGTTQIDAAIGSDTDRNVRVTGNATGTTQINGSAATPTVNALLIDNTGATAATTFSLNTGTVTVASGAVHINQTAGQNFTLNNGTLAFGNAEGVITTNTGGFLTTLGTAVTGSGGLTVSNLNGGGVSLGGVNTFTGGLTIGGNGFVAVDQDQRFGNAANGVTHAGGELRFFANTNSSRTLTLLGNVGNNTLGNNTTSTTIVWTGDISGAGLLRLVNNASTVGTGGFNLGGNNSYSGGTQIEGINVTGSSNNAFGTGTVTLINANSNVASLSLTGSGVSLGGLRGTDGTVTINPTGSSATLTVGSNNENTVFNGVIAQGAGKTGSFTKTGTGTLVLGGTNTYTGTTTVAQGKLLLAVNNAIAAASPVVLSGGTLASGFNQSLGALNLSASSILDLGTGGTFSFADSSAESWTGALSIVGTFTDGLSVRFGTTDAGLTSGQLSQITINGFAATINASGYLSATAVPEPATFAAFAGVFVLGLTVLRRRRHRA